MAFEEFLSYDIGVLKAHLIETKASVAYLYNGDENSRAHGIGNWRIHAFWEEDAPKLDGRYTNIFQAGCKLFNMHRTPWSIGQRQLAEGVRVGIALSDRFGVITTDKSIYPIIVWKTKQVGEVVGERARMYPKFEHLHRVVSALLNK